MSEDYEIGIEILPLVDTLLRLNKHMDLVLVNGNVSFFTMPALLSALNIQGLHKCLEGDQIFLTIISNDKEKGDFHTHFNCEMNKDVTVIDGCFKLLLTDTKGEQYEVEFLTKYKFGF